MNELNSTQLTEPTYSFSHFLFHFHPKDFHGILQFKLKQHESDLLKELKYRLGGGGMFTIDFCIFLWGKRQLICAAAGLSGKFTSKLQSKTVHPRFGALHQMFYLPVPWPTVSNGVTLRLYKTKQQAGSDLDVSMDSGASDTDKRKRRKRLKKMLLKGVSQFCFVFFRLFAQCGFIELNKARYRPPSQWCS